MKERPILFSGPMVRAILSGAKTQTRRVVKGSWLPIVEEVLRVNGKWVFDTFEYDLTTPYGQPGDRLWVRETHSLEHGYSAEFSVSDVWYWADGNPDRGDWTRPRPSIHMPRWASRITLEITDVRVERLNEISEEDAKAEGFPIDHKGQGYEPPPVEVDRWQGYARASFALTWGEIYGAESLKANPWVWVISFRRLT